MLCRGIIASICKKNGNKPFGPGQSSITGEPIDRVATYLSTQCLGPVDTECSDDAVPRPFLSGCKTSSVRKTIIRYIFDAFVKRMVLTESDRLILQGPESVWTSSLGSKWSQEDAVEIPVAYQEGDCAAFYWLKRLAQEEGFARLLATSLDSDLLLIGLLHEERYAQNFYLELKASGQGEASIFDLGECVKDLKRRDVDVRNFCCFCV